MIKIATKHIKYFYLINFLVCLVSARAQHYQFSQFYSAPTYLNPAFTGANACSRLGINYRNQWNGIPGTFTTYQITYDHMLTKYNSGFGLQLYSDKAGSGSLRTTQFNLLYAYELKINREFGARAGFSLGGAQRSIDFKGLTFGDQIARGGASNTVENTTDNNRFYADIGAGILGFTSNAWLGFSVNHLNTPNQSLLGNESRLPMEFKLHSGYKFAFDGDESNSNKINPNRNSITLAANYKKQAKFNQIDLGIYYSKNYIVIGLWYRGIPLFKPIDEYRNNDAIIVLAGVTVEKFKIGYSYDFTVSKLSNYNSKGSHEISLSYQFCNPKKKKKRLVLISCPKF